MRCSNEAIDEAIAGGFAVAVAVALFAIAAIAEPLAQFAEPENANLKFQKTVFLKIITCKSVCSE